MGVKLKRQKKRDFLVSVIYKLQKLVPLGRENKLRFFLKLEWIFDRLVHEMSFQKYDPTGHPLRTHSLRFILKNIHSDHLVLDLGSNDGTITSAIADKAKKVVGIDHDLSALEKARVKYKKSNLEFVHEDALEYLKKSSEKFDVLILSHILEHIDEPELFLKDFKSGFRFIYIEVPDFDKTYPTHYRKDLNMDLIYTDADHVSEFDRLELAEILNNCGLQVIEDEYRFGVMKVWCKVNG